MSSSSSSTLVPTTSTTTATTKATTTTPKIPLKVATWLVQHEYFTCRRGCTAVELSRYGLTSARKVDLVQDYRLWERHVVVMVGGGGGGAAAAEKDHLKTTRHLAKLSKAQVVQELEEMLNRPRTGDILSTIMTTTTTTPNRYHHDGRIQKKKRKRAGDSSSRTSMSPLAAAATASLSSSTSAPQATTPSSSKKKNKSPSSSNSKSSSSSSKKKQRRPTPSTTTTPPATICPPWFPTPPPAAAATNAAPTNMAAPRMPYAAQYENYVARQSNFQQQPQPQPQGFTGATTRTYNPLLFPPPWNYPPPYSFAAPPMPPPAAAPAAAAARAHAPPSSSTTTTTSTTMNTTAMHGHGRAGTTTMAVLSQPQPHQQQPLSRSQIAIILRQSGFRNDQEVQSAMETVIREQDDTTVLTLENVTCALIQAREEAQLARDMDEARRLSELEYEQEQAHYQKSRQARQDEVLLQATLAQLLAPTASKKQSHGCGGFTNSWLLRFPPLQPLLKPIMEEEAYRLTAKKALIAILQLEQKAHKWYSNDLPRCFYTFDLYERLSAVVVSNEQQEQPQDNHKKKIPPEAIQETLQSLATMIQEGHSLMAHQDKNQIPKIYMQARHAHGDKLQAAATTTTKTRSAPSQSAMREGDDDDDDDDIIVLDEDEIRQLTMQQDESSSATTTTTTTPRSQMVLAVDP